MKKAFAFLGLRKYYFSADFMELFFFGKYETENADMFMNMYPTYKGCNQAIIGLRSIF